MGRYNQLLIEFMKRRSLRIEEIINLKKEVYFNDDDRKDIESWQDDEARDIWLHIKKNVHTSAPAGLRREVCPFCHKAGLMQYKKPFCEDCGFGVRHGICGKKDAPNDYLRIIDAFNEMGMVCGRFFNSDYYENLISELEKSISQELTA